jgi:hypothetical protein
MVFAAQRNEDPNHYQRYWQTAMDLVAALTDAQSPDSQGCALPGQSGVGGDLPWGSAASCQPSPLGMFNRECWTSPCGG